jgi:hypothetical protein
MKHIKHAMLVLIRKDGLRSPIHCKIFYAAKEAETTPAQIAKALLKTGRYETEKWLVVLKVAAKPPPVHPFPPLF